MLLMMMAFVGLPDAKPMAMDDWHSMTISKNRRLGLATLSMGVGGRS